MKTINLPPKFFFDHQERDLPTPAAIKVSQRAVKIDANDPDLPELLSDARYYAEEMEADDSFMRGLIASAKATVKAIKKAAA